MGRNVENSDDNSLAESFFRKEEKRVFFLLSSALVSGIENSPVWSPKSISLRSLLITFFFFFYKTKCVFLKDLGDIHFKCSHQRKQLACLLVAEVSQEPNFHKQCFTNTEYLIKPSHHLLGSPCAFLPAYFNAFKLSDLLIHGNWVQSLSPLMVVSDTAFLAYLIFMYIYSLALFKIAFESHFIEPWFYIILRF